MRTLIIVVLFALTACNPPAPSLSPRNTGTGPAQTGSGPTASLPVPFRELLNPGLGYFPLPSGLESGPWTVGVKYTATGAIPSYTRIHEIGGYNQQGGLSIELNSGAGQNRVACVIFNGLISIQQAVTARVDSLMETPSSASVVCTYSGTTLTMYVNGEFQGSANGVYNTPSWNEGIGLGSAGEFPLTGTVSNVSWWQAALTAAEAALY